jgi:pyruvate dehydrogenase E1 component beta subunit
LREISYSQAINEALSQLMAQDPCVMVMGIGVNSPWYVGNTCTGLYERFGADRVVDTPVSENGISGIGAGAAMAGMRPVVIHPRMDFMLYAMDQIINQAANWHYMLGGRVRVPLTIRGIINRGGEQAAQHSQALHGLFAHVPGLKVVMPSTAYDAKGLFVAAVRDDNPVIYIDDKWLYERTGDVPEDLYSVDIGKGVVRRAGTDVTIIGVSYLAHESEMAAEVLEEEGISAEVIDVRTVKPIDAELLCQSVRKTGRVVVADAGWKAFGVSGEIVSTICCACFEALKEPPVRIALPDAPAPSSSSLEKKYYPNAGTIVAAVRRLFATSDKS